MSEHQPPAVQTTTQAQQSSSILAKTILLIVVIAVIILFAGAWFGWQTTERLSLKIEHISSKDVGESKRYDQQFDQLSSQVKRLIALTDEQSQVVSQLDKQAVYNSKQLNVLHASSRADWLLAEAEYLLRLANQRLNMEGDFAGAESILLAADKVLAENDDPGLYPVRKALSSEITALQAVQRNDIEGIYLKLDALSDLVDGLTQRVLLNVEESSDSESDTNDEDANGASESIWTALREDLRQAVRIERLDEPAQPLLAPSQSYYLKQNLRLMLEQAQLAALKHHQILYERSIEKAQKWVDTYFLLSSQATQSVIDALSVLSEQRVDAEVPDISESLKLLKQRIEAMYRNHTLSKTNAQETEEQ